MNENVSTNDNLSDERIKEILQNEELIKRGFINQFDLIKFYSKNVRYPYIIEVNEKGETKIIEKY